MMNRQAQNTYLRTQVSTAAPWELTTLLFNGCIKFMKQALEGIRNKEFEKKNENIKKATDILDELLITLNHKYEISVQLEELYNYMKTRLMLANMKLDEAPLIESIELMTDLKDTWITAMKELHSKTKVNS